MAQSMLCYQLDRTALQWAAANGHVAVMNILIKAGADVEAQDKVGYKRHYQVVICSFNCDVNLKTDHSYVYRIMMNPRHLCGVF